MDRSEWMAEVCRAAALTMEAHGLGNRTEQLRNVADQLAAAPPPPAEQASGEIQRWRATGDYAYPAEEDADGEFVAYDDHVAALSQRPVVDDAWAEYVAAFVGEAAMRELRRRFDAPQQPEKGEG